MELSYLEEMIHREAQALAGDLTQLGENMVRSHEQRKQIAERSKKEGSRVMAGVASMSKDAVLQDLNFIQGRLGVLINYVEGKYYPQSPHISMPRMDS